MKKLFKRLKCSWDGHTAIDVQRVSDQALLVLCGRCRKEFVFHEGLQAMIPWDEKIAAFYESFSKLEKELKEDESNANQPNSAAKQPEEEKTVQG